MDPSTLPRSATHAVVFSQWAYWCSLAIAALAVRYVPAGSVRTIVILVPALTAALCVSVAFWLYESCDEYVRSAVMRCVVRTAIVVSACTVAYFIAELTGAPRISMLWMNLLGWSVFNAQFVFVMLRR
jgi:hypothetical protein